jgi:hypothetical protein
MITFDVIIFPAKLILLSLLKSLSGNAFLLNSWNFQLEVTIYKFELNTSGSIFLIPCFWLPICESIRRKGLHYSF